MIKYICPGYMGTYVVDELELGARGALEIQDPEQAWWELDRLMSREEPDMLTMARLRDAG